jgi:DNA-binding IclR family transcriptional regulator
MGRVTPAEARTYQVRALERGLQVLTTFATHGPELGLQDLHDALGLNKATLVRLLSVLRKAAFVELNETSGKYRLGIRAFEVGRAYLENAPIEQMALPYLRALSARTGQTANLAILDRFEVVHIGVVEPDRPLRFHTRVGLRDEPYRTALGKVLLAHSDPEALEGYLAEVKPARRTPATIATKAALRRELKEVRAGALAEDREESVPGLRCLAAPVRDASGAVVAAVSISGPAAEFSGAGRPALEAALQQCTQQLSQRLGYLSEPAAPRAGAVGEGSGPVASRPAVDGPHLAPVRRATRRAS